MELRALANRAFYPDAPAMRLHDMPGNGKSQARATRLAGPGRVDPIEALEDPLLFRLWDADAGVRHSDIDFVILSCGADGDVPSRRGVLHRVVQQILQDFLEAPGIAPHGRQARRARTAS